VDLLGVLRACVRRWYVFLPLVGLTAWLCWQQYRDSAPQYTATASFIVAPSTDLIVSRGQQAEGLVLITTPFVAGNAAGSLAGLLTNALNTVTVRERLLPSGGVALAAVRDPEVDDTLVTVSIVATDPGAADEALPAVQGGVNGVLSDIQTAAGAPSTQLFAAFPGGPVDPPVEDYPDRLRSVVAIALAGTLVAVVLSVLAQSLMQGRRRPKVPPASPNRPPAKATARRSGRASSRSRVKAEQVRTDVMVP
jgi:hypothetical protein